jgi:hypothetical protein
VISHVLEEPFGPAAGEGAIGEVEILGLADQELHGGPSIGGTPAGLLDHGGAAIYPDGAPTRPDNGCQSENVVAKTAPHVQDGIPGLELEQLVRPQLACLERWDTRRRFEVLNEYCTVGCPIDVAKLLDSAGAIARDGGHFRLLRPSLLSMRRGGGVSCRFSIELKPWHVYAPIHWEIL